jgi:hypothetical protein
MASYATLGLIQGLGQGMAAVGETMFKASLLEAEAKRKEHLEELKYKRERTDKLTDYQTLRADTLKDAETKRVQAREDVVWAAGQKQALEEADRAKYAAILAEHGGDLNKATDALIAAGYLDAGVKVGGLANKEELNEIRRQVNEARATAGAGRGETSLYGKYAEVAKAYAEMTDPAAKREIGKMLDNIGRQLGLSSVSTEQATGAVIDPNAAAEVLNTRVRGGATQPGAGAAPPAAVPRPTGAATSDRPVQGLVTQSSAPIPSHIVTTGNYESGSGIPGSIERAGSAIRSAIGAETLDERLSALVVKVQNDIRSGKSPSKTDAIILRANMRNGVRLPEDVVRYLESTN